MSDQATVVPVTEGLFEWPSEEPRLIGSKCVSCGHVSFPESSVCGNPDCPPRASVDPVRLSDTGTLYSYTVQRVDHKEPYAYHSAPVPIGTIELPEGINLVSKLTTAETERLEIGMQMQLTVDTLYEEDGTEYLTYYFEPVVEAE